jgi:hypothetical protein
MEKPRPRSTRLLRFQGGTGDGTGGHHHLLCSSFSYWRCFIVSVPATLWRTNDAEKSRSNNKRGAPGYHAAKNDDLGAIWIAFPLCDGGVGSRNGVDQSSISPTIKTGEGNLAQAALHHSAWNPAAFIGRRLNVAPSCRDENGSFVLRSLRARAPSRRCHTHHRGSSSRTRILDS